jgi:hypothetical protein
MTIRYRNPAVLIFNCSLKQTNVRPASAIIARKDGGAERLILGIDLFHIKSCVQARLAHPAIGERFTVWPTEKLAVRAASRTNML